MKIQKKTVNSKDDSEKKNTYDSNSENSKEMKK